MSTETTNNKTYRLSALWVALFAFSLIAPGCFLHDHHGRGHGHHKKGHHGGDHHDGGGHFKKSKKGKHH